MRTPSFLPRSFVLALVCVLLAGTARAGTTSTLYVANPGGYNVQVLSTAGTLGAAIPVTSPATPAAVAFDRMGNLYVANNHSPYSIEKYSPTGADLGSFTTTTTGLNQPEGLAFDSAGNLYVANYANGSNCTIEKYDSTGVDKNVFINLGTAGPVGLAFDLGNLYVVNAKANSISEYSSAGVFVKTITSTTTPGLNGPYRIAFDASHNLYVTSLGTSTIERFNSAGVDVGIFAGGGGLNAPTGLAFDTDGTLYVCNINALNIEKFSPAGTDEGSIGNLPAGSVGLDLALLAPGGQFEFSASSYSTSENAGSVTITVNRVNGSRGATSVTYSTTNGTAQAPFDYTTTNGTLSWRDGDLAAQSFTVPILDSGITSGRSVSFMVALTSPSGTGTLGTPAAATVTITDNDAPPAGQIQFSAAAYPTFEDAGAVTITANRVGGSRGATSVTYGTADGTATAGLDYTQTGGMLAWEDGEVVAKTFTVSLRDRKITDTSVSFTVTLLTVSGTGTLGTPATATVTITDNDAPPAGQIEFSAAAYQTFEDAGTVTITANRVGGSRGATSVTYNTTDGTAKAGVDYTQTGGTLSWEDGDATAQSFTVPMRDRGITGPPVSFTVTLLTVSGTGTLGTPATATVTITDNDAVPSSQLQFSAAAYPTFEDAGTVAITVTRTGGASGAVAVDYTTADGTAKAGTDYTATSGMLAWADGEIAAKTFQVPIADPGITSGAKVNFDVTLIRTSGAATLGTPAQAIVTIADNDAPPAPIQEPTATLRYPPLGPFTVLRTAPYIYLEATVSDPSNQLASAQFVLNGNPISTQNEGGFYDGSFDIDDPKTVAAPPPPGVYQIQFQVTARDGTVSTSAASTINLVDPMGTVTGGATATFLAALDHVNVAAGSTLTVDVQTTSAVDSTGATVSAVVRVDFYANGVLFASRDGNGKTILIPSRAPGRGPITRDAFADGKTHLFEAVYQALADLNPVTLQAVVTTADGLNQMTAPLHLTKAAETGTPPIVALGPLVSGLPIPAGASLVVPVTVSAPSIPVAMVQYYLNGALVSAATAPPYSVTVTPPVAGSYALTAVVTDANGVATFAEPLAFQAVPTVSVAVKGGGLAMVGGAAGKVVFTRTGDDTSTPLTVYFKPTGTARNGVNFRDVGRQLVIPAGASSVKLKIKPLDTGTGPLALPFDIKLLPAPDGSYVKGGGVKAKLVLKQTE